MLPVSCFSKKNVLIVIICCALHSCLARLCFDVYVSGYGPPVWELELMWSVCRSVTCVVACRLTLPRRLGVLHHFLCRLGAAGLIRSVRLAARAFCGVIPIHCIVRRIQARGRPESVRAHMIMCVALLLGCGWKTLDSVRLAEYCSWTRESVANLPVGGASFGFFASGCPALRHPCSLVGQCSDFPTVPILVFVCTGN